MNYIETTDVSIHSMLLQNSMVRRFWDEVQPGLECCGSENYRDWAELAEGLKTGRRVPESCCRPGKKTDCVFDPANENAYLTVRQAGRQLQ